jgi:cationic amino acid transporter 1
MIIVCCFECRVAWIIGWALILEYTVGGSTVARGISPNLGIFFGGQENLPAWLGRHTIPGIDVVVDPCAGLLVVVVTGLLCLGIRESARVQSVMVIINILVLLFVVGAGSWVGFSSGWQGYYQSQGYLPYGVNGMLGGAATLFFAYIGLTLLPVQQRR